MVYLICYDITSNKGRRAVEKIIKNYGMRIQYSVFYADIKAAAMTELKGKLKKVIKAKNKLLIETDSIIIVPICQSCMEGIDYLIRPNPYQQRELFI